MSYKQNIVINNGPVQLVDKSRFGNSVTQGGVTCTNNGDGSWTINGAVTAENRFNLNFYQLGANVIPYWLSYMVPVEHNYYTQDCGYDKLGGWLFYYLEEGKNYENFKIYPQIISLTDTFGSGNEPKNKEQVKAKFPDDLYPYNPTNRVTTYKELIKVSDVCQLHSPKNFRSNSNFWNVSFESTDGKTWTVNGLTSYTGVGRVFFQISDNAILLTKGHYYLLRGMTKDFLDGTAVSINDVSTGLIDGKIFQRTADTGYEFFYIAVGPNVTYENEIFKPQLFDLTEMYGAGNEPKTVAEFKQKFPDELYPYSPNCWITSYKNVSKVADVCQLLDKKEYNSTETINGVTFTNNGDGSYTLNGTCNTSANYNVVQSIIPIIKNHTYLLVDNRSKKISDDSNATVQIINSATTYYFQTLNLQGSNAYTIVKATDSWMCFLRIRIEVNLFYDNVKLLPQLYDLTEMYGEGKEPKTVEEFRAKFPNEMYDYNLCCTV